MITTVLVASGSSALIALLLAIILIFASKVFKVETDEKVETIITILPGANCGGCGYPGCAQFASALAKDEAKINGCPVGGLPVAEKLSEYLGKTPPAKMVKTRSYIFCHGHKGIAKSSKEYEGAKSCAGASMVGGNKDCSYGCVGFLDCKKACNFNAIKESETGVPVIIEENCTSCGACVKACPLKLIEIHPAEQKYHIYCKSHDKGVISKKNCERGCIACNICVKNTKEGGIAINNYLAVVNYNDYSLTEESISKCPTKAITDEAVNCKKA